MLESVYTAPFDRLLATLPAAERVHRQAPFDTFLRQGFPTRALEAWHYTGLADLADRPFLSAAPGSADLTARFLPDTDRLVYVNGHFDRAQSTLDPIQFGPKPPPDAEWKLNDGIDALNAAFASDGLELQLPRHARAPRPLHLLLASVGGDQPAMAHQRHRVVLDEGAELTLIVEFCGEDASVGGGERLLTQRFDVELAPTARLSLYRMQDEGQGSTLLTRIEARLARDSSFSAVCIDAGRGLCRHALVSRLEAAGAETHLGGLYAPPAGAWIDNQTEVVHAAPHGTSRERFHGILAEPARAIFNGRVVVMPGAAKTDSEQRIANLLISRKAEIDAKPELEIYADDVKCAHGNTVGQLDDGALHYLRSRGLTEAEAKALLLRAFAAEALDAIKLPALRNRLQQRLGFVVEEFELPIEGIAE